MTDEEDWKTRYLKEATSWESTDQLLRKTIARLSIAAEGASADLDALLASIQGHARAGEDRALEADLNELTRQIRRMDDSLAAQSAAKLAMPVATPTTLLQQSERDYCEALLDALSVSHERRGALQAFRQRLPDLQPEHCLAQLAAQISSLLQTPRAKSADGDVRELLLALVDEVAVAQPAADGLMILRETLERGEGGDWRRVLERVIAEIRSLIQRISSDKQALEELMQEVSSELGDINLVLGDDCSGLSEGREQSLALHDIIHDGVQRIQTHIDTEFDVERLKAGVNRSVEGIRAGIADFIDKDARRLTQAEARNEELQQRITRMEQETEQLNTKLSRNRKKLMYDSLTGVRSRLSYDEMLAQELTRYARYKEPLCLAVLDIDHFKVVNDSFGHAAGDKALKLVAGMIDDHSRDTDSVFRVGGEEFVLMLPRTDLASGVPLVEFIRQSVGNSGFHFENKPVAITMSAGATALRDDDTAETLFSRADDAMYRAKKSGRDRLVSLD
ncbi:MAG: diguanylate cyclase [Halieaceae bacterium]